MLGLLWSAGRRPQVNTTTAKKRKAGNAELPPTLGPQVCAWIEANLVHSDGDFLGRPFLLEPWQKRIIYRLYELDPETFRRIIRRALVILPKGTGKTELVGAIGLAELAGPTVIDRQTRQATRRRSPNIPCAAASFEQADLVFGAARTMATEGRLAPLVESFDTELLLRGEQGRMYRVAAQAGTNDGGRPTCFLADEIHEWAGAKERVHLVLANSLTKRDESLEVNISTPDEANPETLLGKLVAHGERVASGEVDDPSFLYVRYSAPMDVELNDPEALRAALRACHPASWVDLERVAARWEVDRIPEHEFRRYHLAQFVRASNRFLRENMWESLADPARTVPDGTSVVLGFDGSYNNDSTALVGCVQGAKPHLFVAGAWERPQHAPLDWTVPREEVKAKVDDAMRRYKVVELACDPPGWHTEIDGWAERYGKIVVKYETNRRAFMAHACSRFYTAVANGAISHDGDPRLARHLANAVVKETADGRYITKDGPSSPRKIDLAVAAVVALDRGMTAKPDKGKRLVSW